MTSVMMDTYFPPVEGDDPQGLDFLEDSARSVELVREEGRDGQLTSFGFTLVQEKPPRIGTVMTGGAADKAGLKKGEIVLSVAGNDVTKLSHKEVTLLIRSNTETAIWLSVCENEEDNGGSLNSSFSSSPQKSYHLSTPILSSQLYEDKRFGSTNLTQRTPLNNSALFSSAIYGSSPSNKASPLIHTKVMSGIAPPTQTNDPAYVMFIPSPSYIITRMWSALLYCGPVKIPDSWSQRGVSSLCIQECARQLLGKRKGDDFIKVHLEVNQNHMIITNTSSNVLAKHRREEMYYCGLCSNDEQHFAIVTLDSKTSSHAELCHVFKLLSDSKLSKYCIDKSKSVRETRVGQPTLIKSCIDITETIQTIFQNDSSPSSSISPPNSTQRRGLEPTDTVDYGTVRGINMFQLAPGSGDILSFSTVPSPHSSPSLKRKKSNVVDLRSKKTSPLQQSRIHNQHQRSTSIPINPFECHRPLATTSSAGHVRNDEVLHVRMHSDGSTTSSSSSRNKSLPVSLLRPHPPQDKAKRISDSSLSSVSSDQSGSGIPFHSPSSSPKQHHSSGGSPTPRDSAHPIRPIIPPRKMSHSLKSGSRLVNEVGVSPSRSLRRQGSAHSILDLPGLSPFHSSTGLPARNGHLSSSVDSIVTITTLAEDDLIDTVVGQVATWCGSFDKLLDDPLGIQCLQQFLETQYGEENILFWKDVEQFKIAHESKVSQMARQIYEEYFSPSAHHSINVDSTIAKSVETNLKTSPPSRHMYNEAQKEIYQLMKLDCYPRFKKSQVIQDCMRAEIEGRPLPISLQSSESNGSSHKDTPIGGVVTMGKKKNPSLLSRIKGLQHKSVTVPSLHSTSHPLSHSVDKKINRKERRESKKNKTRSLEVTTTAISHPEENLKQLQVHKSNLFELSLPNRVTKIIEARPNTTIEDAITQVLKKYNYSLDIMEIKLTNTLQPVNVTAQATILIGKHVSVIRSKHTITVKFPDDSDVVLPARTPLTLRDLFDKMMIEKGKTNSYSVFLEGARAPLELNMPAGNLEGHTVNIQYNPYNTFPSNTASTPPRKPTLSNDIPSPSGKISDGVEELFSMIARLSSDTLQDQRTHEEHAHSINNNKILSISTKDNKKSSPKFGRTKSGTAVSSLRLDSTPPRSIPRSLSPPVVMTTTRPLHRFPPPPSSDPPISYDNYDTNYSSGRHIHQRSADAMSSISMGSGSSVDSITHELSADRRLAARNQLRDWVNNSSNGPQYFPTALGTSQDTLDRPHPLATPHSQPNSRGSSLSRHQAAILNPYRLGHTPQQPLDNLVTDAFQRQHQSERVGGAYPWRLVKGPSSTVSSEGQQFSDSESMASSGCHSNASRKQPLSPTTHVLVIEEQGSETFV